MVPALEPGDRLLVDPVRPGRPGPVVGDVVVLIDPTVPGRRLVKRLAAGPGEAVPGPQVPGDPAFVPRGHVYVLADERRAGTDSRTFGPVPAALLVGVAWFRYAPSHRRGPLGPPAGG